MNYKLHQTIHELIPQLSQKYGLKFEVRSKEYILDPDLEYNLENNVYKGGEITAYPAIQTPQIRQILFGLREVLGKNPEIHKKDILLKKVFDMKIEYPHFNEYNKGLSLGRIEAEKNGMVWSKAQSLDDHWFRPTEKDGKYTGQSMFDLEPDTVLAELIEIIKELLK
jgi:hypothetical protein